MCRQPQQCIPQFGSCRCSQLCWTVGFLRSTQKKMSEELHGWKTGNSAMISFWNAHVLREFRRIWWHRYSFLSPHINSLGWCFRSSWLCHENLGEKPVWRFPCSIILIDFSWLFLLKAPCSLGGSIPPPRTATPQSRNSPVAHQNSMPRLNWAQGPPE